MNARIRTVFLLREQPAAKHDYLGAQIKIYEDKVNVHDRHASAKIVNLPAIRSAFMLLVLFAGSLFRAEAFNLTNTPWFGTPNVNINAAQFGTVTPSQTNDPRNVQLAMKLVF